MGPGQWSRLGPAGLDQWSGHIFFLEDNKIKINGPGNQVIQLISTEREFFVPYNIKGDNS